MERLLVSARHLIGLAVASALVSSTAILVFGAAVTIRNVGNMFLTAEFTTEASKKVALEAIEVLDLLFLGVVLYITAIGLYHLFINSSLRLPRWFAIEEFEDLKVILVSVVMVLLVINFTSSVLELTNATDVFYLGAGISLVIVSVGLILFIRTDKYKRAYLDQRKESERVGSERSELSERE